MVCEVSAHIYSQIKYMNKTSSNNNKVGTEHGDQIRRQVITRKKTDFWKHENEYKESVCIIMSQLKTYTTQSYTGFQNSSNFHFKTTDREKTMQCVYKVIKYI